MKRQPGDMANSILHPKTQLEMGNIMFRLDITKEKSLLMCGVVKFRKEQSDVVG